jgi:hypothetical protein
VLHRQATSLKDAPIAWVNKWIDYSSKYGLGYQLSNGVIGVHFNDNTKMTGGFSEQVKYICKAPDSGESETKEMVIIYDLKTFPPEV